MLELEDMVFQEVRLRGVDFDESSGALGINCCLIPYRLLKYHTFSFAASTTGMRAMSSFILYPSIEFCCSLGALTI